MRLIIRTPHFQGNILNLPNYKGVMPTQTITNQNELKIQTLGNYDQDLRNNWVYLY